VPPELVVKIWQVWPGGQPAADPHVQRPPEQTPLGQTVPQFPQLFASVCRSAQPDVQREVPLGQPQLPLEQTIRPGQILPQLPQFCESVLRLVQTPVLPQFAEPAWQQMPAKQT
jgi:hypothetical protein